MGRWGKTKTRQEKPKKVFYIWKNGKTRQEKPKQVFYIWEGRKNQYGKDWKD